MSSKKKELLSSAMRRTSEWISSQEIPNDVTVHIGEAIFPLHKFPLISKCGYIRKLLSEINKTDIQTIEIPKIPGGPEAFELAAKFCYEINFEISTENIAMLRCAAEYLEMTEEYSVGNLVSRTEAYLNEVALKSLSSSVSVLQKAETLFPVAEEVKLVSRCIDAIAYIACKESQFCVSSNRTEVVVSHSKQQPVVDWWAEDLAVLRIDTFQRVVIAMMARGFKRYALGPILMLYAQKSLRGLEILGKGTKKIDPKQEHEKRVVLETIVSLLPKEKNAMSVSFLSMLLRAAIYLETTVACRLDLEKRMALQLGQAVLDDLLIPSYSFTGDTLFDVDTVQRIMMNYIECELEGKRSGFGNAGDDGLVSAPVSDMERVGKLMESYLSEIASDKNLTVPKFIGLAELIPEQSRVTEDGMYRAIDIYLKGCDASVLIASTPNNKAERDHPDNLSLAGDGFDVVDKAKKAVDAVPGCRNKVSCADILTIATRDVVVAAGGPFYAVELGRFDSLTSTAASIKLPEPTQKVTSLLAQFKSKGLSLGDLVALSAAHTVGFSHCTKIFNRIYTFSKRNPVDPTLNRVYANQLRQMCPRNVDPRIAINMDPITPKRFDNIYFKNLQQGKGLFTSDQDLFTDRRTRPLVNAWARDARAFNRAFVLGMTKLGRVGVKTSRNGNIRRNCFAFN